MGSIFASPKNSVYVPPIVNNTTTNVAAAPTPTAPPALGTQGSKPGRGLMNPSFLGVNALPSATPNAAGFQSNVGGKTLLGQ